MISESKDFGRSCFWFSSLVSKESNLKRVFKLLNNLHPTEIKTINIKTGNKTTRIVAWTFLTPEEKKKWKEAKW
jgi:23S rRNA (adenine1618-N6)-methyltransferase